MIHRKHRTVEIYFILYLAAIILLLPDKQSPEKIDDEVVRFVPAAFSMQPNNTSLTCRFYVDTSGPQILSIDSINIVSYYGKVKDINFKFEVEDLSSKQKQSISGQSGYFRFEENIDNQELKFVWTPKLIRNINKTYLVKVIATAKGSNNKDNISEIYKAETQFSLVLTDITPELAEYNFDNQRYIEENPLPQNLNQNINMAQNRIYTSSGGEIMMDIDMPEVKSIAYKNWSNKIYVFGANPSMDLSAKPNVKVFLEPSDNNGSAEVAEIGRNYIVISGRTPSHGRMKVTSEMKFNIDNKKRSIDFYVAPIPIGRPQFESVMYPEKRYEIKTNLPMLSGQLTQAVLRDKKEVILKSEQGEIINFKPDVALIGKILTLERLIDNVVYDKYDIRIHDYPEPIIFNIQKDKELEVKIQTRSFGYFNGEKNLVRLEITGNATDRELRGQITEEDITYLQVFRLTPKDKDKPFRFEVKAIDSRGRASSSKKYGWNE